jgi:hypothetical protein
VREHAFNGEVRLAGVRGAENGPDTGVVAGGQRLRSRLQDGSGDRDAARAGALQA